MIFFPSETSLIYIGHSMVLPVAVEPVQLDGVFVFSRMNANSHWPRSIKSL